MKAIHNSLFENNKIHYVVLYLKDTQKWKQFTTVIFCVISEFPLCYISKILKNESNSQHHSRKCFLSLVVLYLKDTQKWKQFTTVQVKNDLSSALCYISKILKNESNSQRLSGFLPLWASCVISQRYSKMKAIHNMFVMYMVFTFVVLYLKDTQKWKQFTTIRSSSFSCNLLCYISKILKNESNSQPDSFEY